MTSLEVNLTYFKSSGKYYSESSFKISLLDLKIPSLDDIYSQIKSMTTLPGLVRPFSESEFIVLVEVPEHPHAHPHLLTPSW